MCTCGCRGRVPVRRGAVGAMTRATTGSRATCGTNSGRRREAVVGGGARVCSGGTAASVRATGHALSFACWGGDLIWAWLRGGARDGCMAASRAGLVLRTRGGVTIFYSPLPTPRPTATIYIVPSTRTIFHTTSPTTVTASTPPTSPSTSPPTSPSTPTIVALTIARTNSAIITIVTILGVSVAIGVVILCWVGVGGICGRRGMYDKVFA